MATLSEDSDSWKANGVIRRDFRRTKGDPEVPGTRGRRKNTKRWCKGVVGREHDVRAVIENPHVCTSYCSYRTENGGHDIHPWGTNRRVTKCVACGMDSWSLDRSYKTNPIQQKLADKWCGGGHLYDWLTDTQLAKLGLPRRVPDGWYDRFPYDHPYEFHACVMCGKRSTKRPRRVARK